MENKIAYLCDTKECENGHCDMCQHTLNIEHAVNFKKFDDGHYMEIDRYNEIIVRLNKLDMKLNEILRLLQPVELKYNLNVSIPDNEVEDDNN